VNHPDMMVDWKSKMAGRVASSNVCDSTGVSKTPGNIAFDFCFVTTLIELHLTENDSFKHISKHYENSNRNKVLHCALCGVGQTLLHSEVCKVIL